MMGCFYMSLFLGLSKIRHYPEYHDRVDKKYYAGGDNRSKWCRTSAMAVRPDAVTKFCYALLL